MNKKDINEHIENADAGIIAFASKWAFKASQIALATIFFWFGILKLLGVSAVDELISNLVFVLAPSLDSGAFIIALGVLEILIALTILDRDLLRLSLFFLLFHLILVALPLFFLPEITWQGPFLPTLEGQYILKNILIAVVGMGILADLDHLKSQTK